MNLVYKKHARERMAEREVSQAAVEAVLGNPHHRVRPGPQQSIRYTSRVAGRRLTVAVARPGDAVVVGDHELELDRS